MTNARITMPHTTTRDNARRYHVARSRANGRRPVPVEAMLMGDVLCLRAPMGSRPTVGELSLAVQRLDEDGVTSVTVSRPIEGVPRCVVRVSRNGTTYAFALDRSTTEYFMLTDRIEVEAMRGA